MKKKLLKLKDWVTIPEAARHLSVQFDEEVTEADILRFALDRRLKLSVNFTTHAIAEHGTIVPLAEAENNSASKVNLLDGKAVSFTGGLKIIGGVWDLSMFGDVDMEIKDRYYGRPITISRLIIYGILLNRPDGPWCRLFQSNDAGEYSLAETLPADADLVVRTSALRDLEALLSEPEPDLERPVGPRERTTLLLIIAALAKLARVPVERPSAAAARIESQAALMGVRLGIRTIEEKLKLIPEALRSKADI